MTPCIVDRHLLQHVQVCTRWAAVSACAIGHTGGASNTAPPFCSALLLASALVITGVEAVPSTHFASICPLPLLASVAAALSELGAFYMKSGSRSRLSVQVRENVLGHLAAVRAALPEEPKSLLGL
jgi:hypothetical protein